MGAMTLRLGDGLETKLRLVADVEERPMSEVINEAVAAYCDARLVDGSFRTRARLHLSKLQAVLSAPVTPDKPGPS